MKNYVMGHDGTEAINQAITVPQYLATPDGRTMEVLDWQPTVKRGGMVTISMTVYVLLPDQEKQQELV